MENIFYKRNISRVFDLKGSSRARYVQVNPMIQTGPLIGPHLAPICP